MVYNPWNGHSMMVVFPVLLMVEAQSIFSSKTRHSAPYREKIQDQRDTIINGYMVLSVGRLCISSYGLACPINQHISKLSEPYIHGESSLEPTESTELYCIEERNCHRLSRICMFPQAEHSTYKEYFCHCYISDNMNIEMIFMRSPWRNGCKIPV